MFSRSYFLQETLWNYQRMGQSPFTIIAVKCINYLKRWIFEMEKEGCEVTQIYSREVFRNEKRHESCVSDQNDYLMINIV